MVSILKTIEIYFFKVILCKHLFLHNCVFWSYQKSAHFLCYKSQNNTIQKCMKLQCCGVIIFLMSKATVPLVYYGNICFITPYYKMN